MRSGPEATATTAQGGTGGSPLPLHITNPAQQAYISELLALNLERFHQKIQSGYMPPPSCSCGGDNMMVVSLQGTMAIRVPTRFEVGGPLGWGFPRYPTFCDDWQSSNMLYITGDSFDFQYGRGGHDSVLVVNQNDYNTCNVMQPIEVRTDGPHDFILQSYSMVHFISGAPGHCQAGQKMRIETFGFDRNPSH